MHLNPYVLISIKNKSTIFFLEVFKPIRTQSFDELSVVTLSALELSHPASTLINASLFWFSSQTCCACLQSFSSCSSSFTSTLRLVNYQLFEVIIKNLIYRLVSGHLTHKELPLQMNSV